LLQCIPGEEEETFKLRLIEGGEVASKIKFAPRTIIAGG
jgi:hypothetical protein